MEKVFTMPNKICIVNKTTGLTNKAPHSLFVNSCQRRTRKDFCKQTEPLLIKVSLVQPKILYRLHSLSNLQLDKTEEIAQPKGFQQPHIWIDCGSAVVTQVSRHDAHFCAVLIHTLRGDSEIFHFPYLE